MGDYTCMSSAVSAYGVSCQSGTGFTCLSHVTVPRPRYDESVSLNTTTPCAGTYDLIMYISGGQPYTSYSWYLYYIGFGGPTGVSGSGTLDGSGSAGVSVYIPSTGSYYIAVTFSGTGNTKYVYPTGVYCAPPPPPPASVYSSFGMGDPYEVDVYNDFGPATIEVNLDASNGSWNINLYGGLIRRTIGSPTSGYFGSGAGTYVYKVTVFQRIYGFYEGDANERGVNPIGFATEDTGWNQFTGYTTAIRLSSVGYEHAYVWYRYRLEIAIPNGTPTFHDMWLRVNEI